MKKKATLSKRFRYARSWLVYPTELLLHMLLAVGAGIVGAILALAFPCGKSYPYHGICASGESFTSALLIFFVGFFAVVVFMLFFYV